MQPGDDTVNESTHILHDALSLEHLTDMHEEEEKQKAKTLVFC